MTLPAQDKHMTDDNATVIEGSNIQEVMQTVVTCNVNAFFCCI